MMIVEGRFEYKRDADDFIPEWRALFRVCSRWIIYTVARKYCDTRGESVMNLEKIFFELVEGVVQLENLCTLIDAM